MSACPHTTAALARILAVSSCDLGDERAVMRALRDAGVPEGSIIVLMDEATDAARAIRQQNIGFEPLATATTDTRPLSRKSEQVIE
jgi:ABC-type sugar transport system substrate-binding protein